MEWLPDISILDVMMPTMDGPTMLASLRSNAQTLKIPVIFVTVRSQNYDLDLFRTLGVGREHAPRMCIESSSATKPLTCARPRSPPAR
jgi:CheY-like chemotaxis protein